MAAEPVLTFAAESILNKVLSLAAQEFSLALGFKSQLSRLRKSFTDIERFLNNVADQPQDRTKSIEEWVKKLKDVAHDAEDVFGEFEYEVARRKVEIQNHMKKKVLNFFSLSNPLAFRLQMAHKIQKINASLVVLKSEASLLGLVSKNKDATPQGIRRDGQANAFIGRDEITVGREDDVSKIVTTLTDSKYIQEDLAVMAIVGMGGLGKTTLAKSVYNEDSIHEFFEKRIWVCVSDPFDVNVVLLLMLIQLNSAKATSKYDHNALLMALTEELKNKRYLLILDDVWNEDAAKWGHLLDCLSKLHSAKGSKIIVTTRNSAVASISQKLLPRHELGELSEDECWSIIKDRAFLNSSAHITHEFQTIGKKIAKKCGGISLVAKVLGGILHTKKGIEEWALFSRIWDNLLKGENMIMLALKLSFDNLESPSLKQCFAYCSIFKKDDVIRRDYLIQLWMAQGLLHPLPGESKEMEDIGNEYFDILLQSSLFEDNIMSDENIVSKCKMHDLVHNLAELVFKSGGIVAQVSASILECSEQSVGKIRSLFFDDSEVPSNILPHFKSLRVLNLSHAKIEEFPILLGRLKQLRYLDISKTRFKKLPSSIGKLYNLQTLRATNCALEEFPKELQNLINLRHIYFDESTKFPQGLRRLTCLRTLPRFSVGNEIGSRIEELAGLNQLKGELVVCNLELIKNGEEAKKAKLENKTKVCHVVFKWTKDRSTIDKNEEENVLEGLQLHPELNSLSIENFMGVKFPSWMCGSLLLNKLKKIQLFACEKCEGVPPLGHLPNLTELKISGMANLKCIGAEFYAYDVVHSVYKPSKEITALFPALKMLYISGCSELIEWVEEPMMSTKNVVVFPCLETLDIRNCSKLRNAPSHFPFLQKLVIISSDSITPIEFLQKLVITSTDSRTPIQEISRKLTTLTSLQIEGIKDLSCLPQGILQNNNNLSSLDIRDCVDLTCIAPYVYGSCGRLERLVIWKCGRLRHLPDGLDTLPLLEELNIYRCPSLYSIPNIKGMASLRRLYIRDCEHLVWLPGLEHCTSLRNLTIQKCDQLLGPLSVWASLVAVSIENCKNLTSVEIKGSGSPTASLQKLRIWDCCELTSIPALPQQSPLQELEIWDCPKLSSFGVKSSRVEEEKCISLQSTSDLRTMTSLRLLRISNCERLESWVSSLQFPLSLETLEIRNIRTLEILPSLDHLHYLRTLLIVGLQNLKYLPARQPWLPYLNELGIGGFWKELDSFPFPDFEVGSLMHLSWLQLYGWPKLKSLPQQIQHLSSLTHLTISSFDGVETLPEWLGSLTFLTELRIVSCKNLMNLPSVQAMQRLTKLQTLHISGCHPLLKERCTRDSGTEWPKISHIPRISIQGQSECSE